MTETKIVLSPLGLKETEMHLLKTISALSEGRGRSYSFVCSQEPTRSPTIWVVDLGSEALWREQHAKDGAFAVFIAPAGAAESEPGHYVVRRPMTPSRLFTALDAVAEKEMGHLAHFVIGGATPTQEAAPVAAVTPTPAPTPATAAFARHTALVVDDSTTIQKQIELSLRAHGISAVCVDSSEAAMDALKGGSFDIIFLDVVLPGNVDGYQICKTIRRDAAHRRTPVVMLTSKSSTFDRVRGSMAGCDTYLTKPVDGETFKEVVEKYLPHVEYRVAQFS